MRIGELIARIDKRIPREFIYYLESKGYINPDKVVAPSGKILRHEYSEDDVFKTKLIWKYYQEGFSPRVAYIKASEECKKTQLKLWE